MYKPTQFNTTINTINENITHGVQHGVLHLSTNGNGLIGEKKVNNFSSYSYLGLEKHKKLIQGTIDATNQYGTQFGYSRAFLSLDIYEELEAHLAEIYGAPVVLSPSTTLAHQAVMPVLIGDSDAIIIDQQAHASMHFTVKNVRDRGVHVEMVRHNRVDQLEEKFLAIRQKYDRVWYIADGVYSMYGDYAPVKELEEMMNKYPQFHVYFDDAHGMSWTGDNGKGYVLGQIDLHPQMILVTSLNKAFAAAGGAIVLPSNQWKNIVRTCGGPLIFSTPIQPPMLGAGLASAKLHLDGDFKFIQEQLKDRIEFCRSKLDELNLPDISNNDSPIFYLPTSVPKVSYNLSKRMINEGYYLTPTLFPAVSMRRAGIRYCINAHNSEQEINDMLCAMAHHYPKAVKQENVTLNQIYKAFKIETKEQKTNLVRSNFTLKMFRTISEIDADEWDSVLGNNGGFDYEALTCFETVYQNNPEKENNWEFYYFIVRDQFDKIVLATFFTKCWCKDDIFKPTIVSFDLELQRQADPYLLCTEVLMMGTMLTEGEHLYYNEEVGEEPISLLLAAVNELQTKTGVNAIYLRDFDVNSKELSDWFLNNSFVRLDLPDFTHVLELNNGDDANDFVLQLPRKKRKEVRKLALHYENKFNVRVRKRVSSKALKHYYQLYKNVKAGSHLINTFDVPFKLLDFVNNHPNWEFIELSLKPEEYDEGTPKLPVAMILCYKSQNNYVPGLIGLNYEYLNTHKIYKQSIWQIVKRSIDLECDKVYFGITATTEKKRFGASAIPKHVFVRLDDSFNADVLQLASANSVLV